MLRNTSFSFSLLIVFLLLNSESTMAADSSTLTRPDLDSQSSYSFEDLLDLGLEYNYDVKSAGMDVAALRWDKLVALGTILPTLSADASFSLSEYHTFSFLNFEQRVEYLARESIERSTGSNISVGLNYVLFKGFANFASMEKARLLMDDVVSTDLSTKNMFLHDLRKVAHRVLAARASLDSEKALLAESREQHRLARTRYEIGAVIELDVLQTEINLGRQKINVEGREQELRSAWDALTLLIGLEPSEPALLAMEFSAFEPEWTVEELLKIAFENRQDLQASSRSKQVSKMDVTIARSAYMPTVSVGLQHSRSVSRPVDDFQIYPDNYSNYAGLRLSLPLFQGFNSLNSYKRSNAEVRRSDLRDQQLTLQIKSEVRDAIARLRSTFKQSSLAEKNRDLARRSLDLERERYRLGLASLLNVQSAEAVYRQAEADHLNQLLSFHDRLAELELAIGLSLDR
jgi:outer membrane protein